VSILIKGSLLFFCAQQYLNAPYRWGANGPFEFDCSALVLQSWRDHNRIVGNHAKVLDMTSQGLYTFMLNAGYQCEPPSEGCILFYGKSLEEITHVAIHGSGNIIIEAGGAGRGTKTLSMEHLLKYCGERDARVRYRNFGHRKDLVASIRFEEK